MIKAAGMGTENKTRKKGKEWLKEKCNITMLNETREC